MRKGARVEYAEATEHRAGTDDQGFISLARIKFELGYFDCGGKGAGLDLFKPGLFVFEAEPPGAVAGIDREAQREALFDKVDFEKDAAAAASVLGSQYIS